MTPPIRSLVIPRTPHIVLVDDDPGIRAAMKRMLRSAEPDWLISTASNGKQALAVVDAERVDVVVTDLHMPVMDGFELLAELQRSHPETIRIVHSSQAATLPRELLAHHVLGKPTSPVEAVALLRRALRTAGAAERRPEMAEA